MSRLSRLVAYCSVFVFALVLCRAAHSQGTSITPEMQTGDTRLQKRVSLLAPNTTLKDALAELQKQTGVVLSVRRLSPSQALQAAPPLAYANEIEASVAQQRAQAVMPVGGETDVCVLFRDVPLGDALDALYSLMSYQGARWTWNRDKQAAGYAYELRPSLGLARLVEGVRQEMQTEFEKQDGALQAALKLSPDALKEAAKTNYNLVFLAKNSSAQNDEREALEAFFTSLSPMRRLSVMRGKVLVLPVASLSEKGKMFAAHQSSPDDPSKVVTFTRQNIRGMMPGLFISTDGAVGGASYIGTTWAAADWKKHAVSLWHLKDDAPEPNAKAAVRLNAPAKPLPFPKETDAAVSDMARQNLEHLLWRTGEAGKVSLAAILPPLPPPGVGVSYAIGAFPQESALYGSSLAAALEKLHMVPPAYLNAKWRGNILLLRNASGPFGSANGL